MRLIDADELKNELSDKDYITYTHEYGDAIPVEWVMSAIDNAPTVEMKPFASFSFDKDELNRIVEEKVIEPIKNGELVVKTEKRPQGKWIFKHNSSDVWCSNCDISLESNLCEGIKFSYCPNCGADMRGGRE